LTARLLEYLVGIVHLPSKFNVFRFIAANMTNEDEEGLIKKLISIMLKDANGHLFQFLIDERGHLLTQL